MDARGPSPGARSVAAAQGELGESRRRVDSQVRRGHRFSWFAWGFLFALALGEVLLVVIELLYPMVTTTVTVNGTSTTSTAPLWGPFVAFAPAVVILGLAIRELVVGRREAADTSRRAPPTRTDTSAAPPWIEEVRVAQQRLTKTASEIEWSFVPLVLGFIGLAELALVFVGNVSGLGGFADAIFLPSLGGLVIGVLPLWPLYRLAKQWIRADQERLEIQSRELARLEAEFLWRFSGAGSIP
jgi:hypothetical protein